MKLLKLRKYALMFMVALVISFGFVFCIKKNLTGKTVSNKVEKLTKNEIEKTDIESEDEADEEDIFVDVKGSVKSPGVYKLTNKKIVMDAINSAGGLEDYADTTYINLSKKLIDEMVIYIFSKDEVSKLIENNEITDEKASTIGGVIQNDAYIESNAKENVKTNNELDDNAESIEEDNESDNKSTIININTANKEELMNLNGIGESKAQNIINYRVDNGDFKSIEDIKNVKGIGDSIFEKIKNDICV